MPVLIGVAVFSVAFPFVFSVYQVNIMVTALTYVMLGLGLNIVVGLAGLLDLGYVAFYAVGAYSYALLNYHFGLGFWFALPIGAGLGALFRYAFSRLSGAPVAGGLPGHRHPGVRARSSGWCWRTGTRFRSGRAGSPTFRGPAFSASTSP